MMRTPPANAMINAPAMAESRIVIPSGKSICQARILTETLSRFCRMNTSSKINTIAPMTRPTQVVAALVRSVTDVPVGTGSGVGVGSGSCFSTALFSSTFGSSGSGPKPSAGPYAGEFDGSSGVVDMT